MKLFLFLFIFIPTFALSQSDYLPFQGRLIYSIEITDTSLTKFFPSRLMTIYTNDTIVRIENYSEQFGPQTLIKHTILNKSILLITAKNQDYAIQTNLNDTSFQQKTSNFTYKKLHGRRRIAGQKAKRMLVINNETKQKAEIWYLKDYSPKYIDAYNQIPGLPVRYFLSTQDGTFCYTLRLFEQHPVNKDLFGVPKGYKKVSFSEFLEEILKN